jgi:hypothetical protein
MRRYSACLTALLACLASSAAAQAQYSRIEAPFGSIGNSFYESIGVSWGLQGNGWFARFGGPPVPQFGGFDPAAQGQLGLGFRGNGMSGFLNLTAGQGSDSSIVSQTPSVVLPNGGFGFVSDTLQRPFVLGIVPVIGDEPISPVKQALSRLEAEGGLQRLSRDDTEEGLKLGGNKTAAGGTGGRSGGPSSAERGDVSVAEIRARQAAEDAAAAAEIDALVDKAAQSESVGKLGLARIYYRQALRRASGSRQTELEAQLRAIEQRLAAPAER